MSCKRDWKEVFQVDGIKLVNKLVNMKVVKTGMFEAKTHFSELVQKVQEEGLVYCITKRGEPVAELRPIGGGARKKVLPFGYGKGTVTHMAEDFDAPLEEFREYSE